jgi:acetylornithine/N-succinyldiaminopimelate aminotransferase
LYSSRRATAAFLIVDERTSAAMAQGSAGPDKSLPAMQVGSSAVMATYARQDVVFERGEGSWLISTDGERYLDFGSGVAVNALGHAHPHLVAALTDQAQRLWHTSNLYRVAGQERLAERLCAATFADRVFFCNSGAEACEGAIKAARRYQHVAGRSERKRIVTFEGSFHGRTLATLSAAGNAKYLEGFDPPMPGFDHVPFGDHAALEQAIGPETAAIMIEPVQGEGGVRVVPSRCLAGLRELCDKHGILLVLDEVQTGMGRTGRLFAHEWAGIKPDIMAIAKGIGGGFPVGAVLATEEATKGMTAGTHGSTFGGNPLAMAVGNAVLDCLLEPDFLPRVEAATLRLKQHLARLKDEYPSIVEDVRGMGLLSGIKLKKPVPDLVRACLNEKLLTVGAGDNVMRLLPPLNVKDDELADAAQRLDRALRRLA